MRLTLTAIGAFAAMLMQAATISSPSGSVKLNFSVDASGRPTYEMEYAGQQIIAPSRLGLQL